MTDFQITGKTRLFAILADPVHHVQTPMVMHDVFRRHGIDGVLVPMHVTPADLRATVEGLRGIHNFGGFIATMPHKEAMLSLCDSVSDDARAVGAVNCVRRDAQGRMVGAMLDGIGFVEGLRRHGHDPRGLRAVVAGAGGAASAIAFALAGAGVRHLTVTNRTMSKAAALAARVADAYPDLTVATGDGVDDHDLVVNATSLGMRPDDPFPLDLTGLHPDQIVAEAIMDPAETPLLAGARAVGCRTHPGLPMLAAQIDLMARHMGALT